MPKSNSEILAGFNASLNNSDLRASLNKQKNNHYENGIFDMIYNKKEATTAVDKEIIFNEFFADLFDVSNIKWNIKNQNNQPLKEVTKYLEKYLAKTDFALKLWITKFRSGMQGKYGLVISKEVLITIDNTGLPYTAPALTPAAIVFKNVVNSKILEVSVSYDDFPLQEKSIYFLRKNFSLIQNGVAVKQTLLDFSNNKVCEPGAWPEVIKTMVKEEPQLEWSFIPVAVLKNDLSEKPRIEKVKNSLQILNRFDEIIAILPFIEKGGLIINGDPVSMSNQQKQDFDFMKDILMKGFVRMKPIDLDGMPSNLSENVVQMNQPSNLQTTRNTRNDLYNEIKTDIGIPNMDEVKSAQQSTAEIMIKQFLTSPVIQRETMLMKTFLIDLAKKFLCVLKECTTPDKAPEYDVNKLEIDVELELNTDKNVNQIIAKANGVTPPVKEKDDEKQE